MSKPVFSDLFAFSGRRNRKSFILLFVAFVAVLMAMNISGVAEPTQWPYWLVFYALSVPFWIAGAQRFRDLDWSGHVAWIYPAVGAVTLLGRSGLVELPLFVSYGLTLSTALVSFGLMVVGGTRGPNRYGPDPLAPPEAASVAEPAA